MRKSKPLAGPEYRENQQGLEGMYLKLDPVQGTHAGQHSSAAGCTNDWSPASCLIVDVEGKHAHSASAPLRPRTVSARVQCRSARPGPSLYVTTTWFCDYASAQPA